MTRRHLFFAFLLTAAAAVKGARIFFESIDEMTAWLCESCDGLDLGWDVEDYVPVEWVGEQ